MKSVDKEAILDIVVLKHPAKQYFVIKRDVKRGRFVLRKFDGGADHISNDIRLKKTMLSHHLDYGNVFDGYGSPHSSVSIEEFEDVLMVIE